MCLLCIMKITLFSSQHITLCDYQLWKTFYWDLTMSVFHHQGVSVPHTSHLSYSRSILSAKATPVNAKREGDGVNARFLSHFISDVLPLGPSQRKTRTSFQMQVISGYTLQSFTSINYFPTFSVIVSLYIVIFFSLSHTHINDYYFQ